jgi:hypothetical protein
VKRVRPMRFETRSCLPTSAVCVVANGVRETLSSLLGAPASMRLCEPSLPAPHAWSAIVAGALLYRVRGGVAVAALILRAVDAIAIAAAIFGELEHGPLDRALSPIEREVVDRTASAIAGNLTAICGACDGHRIERVAAIDGFATYFELLLEEPAAARIGIALSRDPLPEPRACVEIGHLGPMRIAAAGSIDLGLVDAATAAALAPGAIVPLRSTDLHRCTLTAHGGLLARGRCGVRNGRYALTVDA